MSEEITLHRRYEMEIKIGADDIGNIRGVLNSILYDLARYDDNNTEPMSQVSGGYGANHTLKMVIRPEVTHDSYMEQLTAILEEKRYAKGGGLE